MKRAAAQLRPARLGQLTRSLAGDAGARSTSLGSAEVVVLGGGSIGCSTLYHLTKLGKTDVALVERHAITSGTTWHTAGLVWSLRPNDIEMEMMHVTQRVIGTELPAITGESAGWTGNGGLFIATSKERLREYSRMHSLGKAYGIESHMLTPKETKDLYPLLNVDDIIGSMYSPADGCMDPTQWCNSLIKAAKLKGARLLEHTPVTKILSETTHSGLRQVVGVETENGTIKTRKVINCGGAWAPRMAAMGGLKSNTMAYRHAYVITQPIEGIRGMPNVRDHDGAFYLRVQGDALQAGGYETNPLLAGEEGVMPEDFAFSLYDLDYDVAFGGIFEACVNRLPALASSGIRSEICGPLPYTPDHRPLLGESPELLGYFDGNGFDLGMMMGGGAGEVIADWATNGRPTGRHMFNWDTRRFHPKVYTHPNYLRERTHEGFAKMYSIVFPKDQKLAGRGVLKSPMHDTFDNEGAFWQEGGGHERPSYFSPTKTPMPLPEYHYYGAYGNKKTEEKYHQRLLDEYSFDYAPHFFTTIRDEALAARNDVVAIDLSPLAKTYLTGEDAEAAAQWLFTANMGVSGGRTVYTCMLNDGGGTEGDLTVSALEPSGEHDSPLLPEFNVKAYYVLGGAASGTHEHIHMATELRERGFSAQLQPVDEEIGVISVQGPKSRQLLASICPADLSNDAFPFSTHQISTVGGIRARLLRLSFVGELGWEVHVAAAETPALYAAVKAAGASLGVRTIGQRAVESLAAEKGYRFWDSDLRQDDTPLEAGLGFTCKLGSDIPFKGREALEKQKKTGLMKRLVCVTLDEKRALWGLEAIFRDGVPVGYVRRGEFAFALDRPIAFGYVKHPEGKPVTLDWIRSGKFTLESFGQAFPASVSLASPFDPKNKRIQGEY